MVDWIRGLILPNIEGSIGKLLYGVNKTIEAIVEPLRMSANYVDRNIKEIFRKKLLKI